MTRANGKSTGSGKIDDKGAGKTILNEQQRKSKIVGKIKC